MGISAAVIGGSALIGAGVQGYYASEAADAAAEANDNALNHLRESESRGLGYLKPYSEAGELGLGPLTGLLTGNQYDPKTGQTTALNPEQRNSLFQSSPGYQFQLSEGQRALQNSQAARGNLLSGGAVKEGLQYSQGLASQDYNNYINQLAGLTNIGQNAATGSANTAIGSGTQIANNMQNAGNIQAQGALNQGNIYGNLFNQIGGIAGLSGLGANRQKPPIQGANGWNYDSNSPNFSTQLQTPVINDYSSLYGTHS